MKTLSDILNMGTMLYVSGCYATWSYYENDNTISVVRETSMGNEYYYILNNSNYLLADNKVMVCTKDDKFIQLEVYTLEPVKLER